MSAHAAAGKPRYRSLDPEGVLTTARRLNDRVAARFPDSGLSRVCRELVAVAEQSMGRASLINRPNRLLRCAVAGVLVLLATGLALILVRIELMDLAGTLSDLAQGIDAVLNMLILGAGGIYFLVTYEQRLKRHHILTAMHELRSLAHIIDMHQLTKDPERLSGGWQSTPASPQPTLTRFQLGRYLDYCSEMLAVVSKLAALYAQHFDDAETLRAVDEIENLTTALSGKIWQKITILSAPRKALADSAPL